MTENDNAFYFDIGKRAKVIMEGRGKKPVKYVNAHLPDNIARNDQKKMDCHNQKAAIVHCG